MTPRTYVTFEVFQWGESIATIRYGRNRSGPVHTIHCLLCRSERYETQYETLEGAAIWLQFHLRFHHERDVEFLRLEWPLDDPRPIFIAAALGSLERAWGFPLAGIPLLTWHGDSTGKVPA